MKDYFSRVQAWLMRVKPLRMVWACAYNLLGTLMRKIISVGPQMVMYPSLARHLIVTDMRWRISLVSGMQTPILDAVMYLAKIGDHGALPLLYALHDKIEAEYQGKDRRDFHGQFTAPIKARDKLLKQKLICVILQLEQPEKGKKFVERLLGSRRVSLLCTQSIKEIGRFAEVHCMSQLDVTFFELGRHLKEKFDGKWLMYKEQRGERSICYDDLYSAMHFFCGAYCVSRDEIIREAALKQLVAEYNHPDHHDGRDSRPHEVIGYILTHLIERELNEFGEKRIRLMLDAKRFEHDVRVYRPHLVLD